MKEILGKPLLEYQIDRVKRASALDEICVATTRNETDKPIVEWASRGGVPLYQGSEEDVLSRYYEAAVAYRADTIVRLTADCPLIDPQVIDRVVHHFRDHADRFDYVSNTLKRTFPRGMDVEALSLRALKEAHLSAMEARYREHVTPYIHTQPQRYRLANITYCRDESRHRWTVDTPEDFVLIQRILEGLFPRRPDFSMEEIFDVLTLHPDWQNLNRHVVQKGS